MPTARKKTGTDEKIAKRRAKAFDLRINGANYRQIAAELSVSIQTVSNDINGELDRLKKATAGEAERLRDIELHRLDRWQRAMTAKMANGSTQAVQQLIKISERRAKLLGLDAPTSVTHDGLEGLTFTMRLGDE